MFLKVVIPVLAVLALGFTVYTMGRPADHQPLPFDAPATVDRVAGTGTVEPQGEVTRIAPGIEGVVERVLVQVGQEIKTGEPLFQVATSEWARLMAVREASLALARAELAVLEAQPRPEEVVAATARVDQARAGVAESTAHVAEAQRQVDTHAMLPEARSISADERARTRAALAGARAQLAMAQARLREAEAALALVQAGTEKTRLAAARARVGEAHAEVDLARAHLARTMVHAPQSGIVLAVNIRVGEAVSRDSTAAPPVVLGDVHALHVRVAVDEADAHRVQPGMPAVAYPRGDRRTPLALRFVRIEPMVVPKRTVTRDLQERVDTRVLHVLYTHTPTATPLYVGQVLDVFIDTAARVAVTPTQEATP